MLVAQFIKPYDIEGTIKDLSKAPGFKKISYRVLHELPHIALKIYFFVSEFNSKR